MINTIQIVESMGYRKPNQNIKRKKWLKPFGFTVLAISLEDQPFIAQYFYGANNKLLIWSKKELNINDNLLNEIKEFEEYDVKQLMLVYKQPDFSFLIIEQLYSDIL